MAVTDQTIAKLEELKQNIVFETQHKFNLKAGLWNYVWQKDITGKPNLTGDFTKYSSLTAYDHAEGADATPSSTETTKVQVTAGRKTVLVDLTDEALRNTVHMDGLVMDIADEAVEALAVKMESDILALISSFTTNSTLGTTNTDFSFATFNAARRKLRGTKGVDPNQLVLVSSVTGLDDLLASIGTGTTTAYQNIPEQFKQLYFSEGQLETLRRVLLRDTQLIEEDGNNDTTALMFERRAIGMVFKNDAISSIADSGNGGSIGQLSIELEFERSAKAKTTAILFSVYYGVGIVNNEFGQQILVDGD